MGVALAHFLLFVARSHANTLRQMADFICADIDIEPAVLTAKLDFYEPTNPDTGEVIPDHYGVFTKTATIGAFQITIKTYHNRPPRIKMTGSLHKYYTGNFVGEGENYSDFGFTDICTAIHNLCDTLKIAPDKFIIHQIEFGLNVRTLIPPYLIINQILSHKGIEYELRKFNGVGYLIRFNREQYSIKIYDKGLQYGLIDNLLRFEVKVNKMAYFKCKEFEGCQIVTLADLLNFDIYSKLKNKLLHIVTELIFTDDRVNVKAIAKTKDRLFFKEATNPRYWIKLRRESYSKTFNRQMQRFDTIRVHYAPDDIKKELSILLDSKFNTLFQNVPFSPKLVNAEMSHFHTHIGGELRTTTQRQCLTCGRDISGQRPGSYYCSELLHGREVKKCRNRVSNLKVHEMRYYPGATLFNVDEYLQPEYRRLKTILVKTLI